MSQYSESYTGPQDQGGLVTNPRYESQAGETLPQGNDGRGPYQESRYGAVPLGTGQGEAPREGMMDKMKDAVGMGPNSRNNDTTGYGEPRREGMLDKAKDAVGMGPNSGSRYGEPGYDQSRTGYGEHGHNNQPREGMLDKAKDAVGMGPNSGNRYGEPGYDQTRTGYGEHGYNQPREGIVDKAKDAVGMGPNAGNRYGEPGYDQSRTGYGEPGYNQPREGIVDKAKDAVGMGPNSGYGAGQGYRNNEPGYESRYGEPGYDQNRREGVVDKAKDAMGMGPNTYNHPSENRGFGGGLGRENEPGYNTGMATGADAYRHEGVVDKMKDAAGVGPNSGYDARMGTGHDAYVHGNHPHGMQDRIQGVNEPTYLSGPHGIGGEHGLGRNDGILTGGEHIPQSMLGERRTEPGYDMSKGTHHLPGHGEHHTGHGMGMGGLDSTERMRKGDDDVYDNKFSGTDHVEGKFAGEQHGYDETPYDDTTTHTGTGAPPKKGLITKIKEKIHHSH